MRGFAITLLMILFNSCMMQVSPSVATDSGNLDSFMFNGHHIMISDMMVRFTDREIDDLFLDMLLSLGVDSVSIYISNATYKIYADRYDHIIDRIKSEGKKLVLLPYILPGKNEPLDEYFSKRLNVTLFHVKKYQPDIVIILNEPSILGGVEMPASVLQKYAEKVSSEIKNLSIPVKVMVTVHSFELFLIPYFIEVKNIDIIGINLYTLKNFEKVEKAIKYIQSNGKEACIWETWWRTQKIGGGEKLPFKIYLPRFRSYKHQDEVCEWISFVYNFSLQHNMSILNPFFTEQFVYCNFSPYLPMFKQFFELIDAIKEGRRTMSYYFYRDLIDGHKYGNTHVHITRPINCLYLFDKEFFPLHRAAVVLGDITIHAESINAERVEFYIDGELMSIDYERPFEWVWENPTRGEHDLEVVAYGQGDSEEEIAKVYVL